MKAIQLKARAKINISLDILGRRENGYHDVEMIMQTIELYDKLNMSILAEDQIVIKSNIPYLPVDDRNLVYKIIRYMKEEYSISKGVYVDLYKMIPIAAGLAGGSSDAAATIEGMNRLFSLNLDQSAMLRIGEKFGSDIAFCMIQGTALATGLGEKIEPLDDFPEMKVLLAKPNFGVSTADVYKNFDIQKQIQHPDTQGLILGIKNRDQEYICQNLANVLEEVTIRMKPSIQNIKDEMKGLGADGVLMSGSGPTVYGLFQDETIAKKAYKQMKYNKELQFVYLTEIYNRRKG